MKNKIKDFMKMASEAKEKARTPLENQKLFTEMLFEELGKMTSDEVATHLTCVYDLLTNEYVITLKFLADATFNKINAIKSNVK